MPTVHITPTLRRGTIEFFSRIIWNKRCATCHKHAWIGYWKVFLHRARCEDGLQRIERVYYCCLACLPEEVTLVNETGHRLMIRTKPDTGS